MRLLLHVVLNAEERQTNFGLKSKPKRWDCFEDKPLYVLIRKGN